jgi:glycosyltransferase involved in cell wall biosynthesis
MNILYIITRGGRGGAQQNVLSLVQGMIKGGHEVQVGCGERGGWLLEEAAKAGALVHYIPHLRRSWNPLDAFKMIGEVKDLVAVEQPEVVHFHSSNALLGAIGAYILGLYRPRLVFTMHGLSVLHPAWRRSPALKTAAGLAMRFGLVLVDRVIFVCRADLDYAQRLRLIKPGSSAVIWNGVGACLEALPREEARKAIGAEGFTVGTVARLDYQKHLELLIEAVAKTPGVALRLLSSGPEQKALSDLIAKLGVGDRVKLVANMKQPSKCVPGFDCFALSSRFEGLPYAVLEAAAIGVPVVATAVGGVPEILTHAVSGRLVPPELVEPFAEELAWVRDHAVEAQDMAAAARTRVTADFSEEEMVSRTLELYLDAVGRR